MNKLYYGDNLDVLRKHIKDESIDLCYIDPPFNSKRNYNQIYNNIGTEDKAQAQAFVDTWVWDSHAINGFDQILANDRGVFSYQTIQLIAGLEKVLGRGSLFAYLTSMTLRLAEIHRVLKTTGSFYLHCDPSASHYLKIILDSIFCGQGGDFKNEIVWERTTNSGSSKGIAKKFPSDHDTILYYVKNKDCFNFKTQYRGYSQKYIDHYYIYDDGDGKGKYQIQALKTVSKKRLEELEKEDRIVKGKGKYLRFKDYLKLKKGVPTNDIWTDIEPVNPVAKEKLGYPTQKPEALLERIINTSTNEGDVILDAYCGCGTTVSVCQRLSRQWIGVDITYQSISLILKRLEDSHGKDVMKSISISGMPKDFASAEALAHKEDDRLRKEFEKWCVLTFSNNRAMINEKKGSDKGIDGKAFIVDRNEKDQESLKDILFSVKSDKAIKPSHIREFYGVIQRDKAAFGYFLCLNRPSDSILREVKQFGTYRNSLFGMEYPVVEIVTVEDILKGQRIRIPESQRIEVLKTAAKAKSGKRQLQLFDEADPQPKSANPKSSKRATSRLNVIDRDIEIENAKSEAKKKVVHRDE